MKTLLSIAKFHLYSKLLFLQIYNTIPSRYIKMQMLKIQKYILTISIFTACTIKTAEPVNRDNPQNYFTNRVFFDVTYIYNDHQFHAILDKIDGATPEKPIIRVERDIDGKLKIYALSWSDSLNGKYTNQYEQARIYAKKPNAHIINFNFNTPYEKDRTGLYKLATNDGNVTVHPYETTDTYAPSSERLLNMRDKIKNRTNNNNNQSVANFTKPTPGDTKGIPTKNTTNTRSSDNLQTTKAKNRKHIYHSRFKLKLAYYKKKLREYEKKYVSMQNELRKQHKFMSEIINKIIAINQTPNPSKPTSSSFSLSQWFWRLFGY